MLNRILMGMSMLATADAGDVSISVLEKVLNWIWLIMSPLLGIAIAVAMIYAIVVGAKMARADSAEQREEAKKKVVYTVIGIAVAIGLMLILLLLKSKLPDWIGVTPSPTPDQPSDPTTKTLIGLL